MLAGEKFTDRPRCVCEVIGAFLRSWNDRASYINRQGLYPFASRVIGTNGGRGATRLRRDICLGFAGATVDGGPLRRFSSRLRMRARIAWLIGLKPALRLNEGAGEYAARLCFGRHGPEVAFELLERMLEVGAGEGKPAPGLPAGWVPGVIAEPTPVVNGNGSRNARRRDELGVRATIIARKRAEGSDAAANGDGNGAARREQLGARS
jgi:hypothetical protein